MEASLAKWPGPFEQVWGPILPRCCIWNLIKISSVVSMEKFENVDKHTILLTVGKGHWMTIFDILRCACSTYFHFTKYHCFEKMQCLTFSPFNIPRDQISSSWKMCQGKPRVTIWTNLIALSHLMLHTKFQASGSGEEDCLRFSPFIGIVAILFLRPGPFEQIFNLALSGCCRWNSVENVPSVSENGTFENVNLFNPSDLWPSSLNEAPSSISESTIPLEKYNVSPSLHSKAQGTIFDLRNKSRAILGHLLNKLGSTQSPNATYQASRQSSKQFWSGRLFKVFTKYEHCGHLWHETMDHLNKFLIYHCQNAVYKIWLKLA